MGMRKISIIIPIYNVALYIADCLRSVIRQTYDGPLECVLVDDCGTDNSVGIAQKIIAEYEGPIDFRVVHHERNKGLSAARNTGMKDARGDCLFFLDSDDWISDDCIEKLTQPLQQKEFDIVVGNYETVGELPYQLELSLPEGAYREQRITHTFCNGGVYVMAVNKLYSKEFLTKNQLMFEEGKVHEDEILAFELSCLEKSFYVVKAVTYYYRIRENSIATNKDRSKKLERYIGVFQCIKEKVKRYEKVDGIYDHYLFFIRRVFRWISGLDLDEEQVRFADEQTEGFLEEIPSLFCMKEKSNRLAYFACKNKQT
ncbi:MAG: glycosyltransferase family 2 protein, partial [Alphaproteobacteria bacterium]|nr:glycosyltransferase family 2 protein [Alphaproteobacteria bacterium]